MLIKAIVLVLFTISSVFLLEKSQKKWIQVLLNWIPAILFAYVIPAIFTHSLNLDMSKVELHGWSKDYIIPFAILMVMSALSFKQLRIIGLRPIILFAIGSLAIAVLAPVILLIFNLFTPQFNTLLIENENWKGLVPIVGSWIGGSTSQLVLKELVGCPEGLFLTILVLDNILVNIWTILMFQLIKKSDKLNSFFGITDKVPDFVKDENDFNTFSIKSMVKAIVFSVSIIALLSFLIDSFLWKIIIFSVLGLAIGNFIPKWNHTLVLKLGGLSIICIMAILGLKLNFNNLSMPINLVLFVIIWLISHFIIMMFVAKKMKLHMAWVPIASMANLGGISTAPAVTAAYNKEWMPHAILLAILSMVSGTFWGMVTIYLFGLF
ncbi:MAG: putative membrane protein [bacterium]|jgi:uncharacterized membrane protein